MFWCNKKIDVWGKVFSLKKGVDSEASGALRNFSINVVLNFFSLNVVIEVKRFEEKPFRGGDSEASGALPNQWKAALPVPTIPTKHTPVTVILMMRNEDDNEDQDQNQDLNDDNHLKAACHELLSCEDAILVCIQSGVILVLTNGVNTKNS